MARPLIRVSRVLQQIFPGSFDAVPVDSLKVAVDRGNKYHDLAKQICLSVQFPEAHPFSESDFPEDAHIIQAVRGWLAKHGAVPLLIETRLVNLNLNFSGTPDLVCRFRNGWIVVVDFKFTAAIAEANRIQVVAYSKLVEQNFPVDRMMIVKIDPYHGEVTEEVVHKYGNGYWMTFLKGLQDVLNCVVPGEK